MVCSTRRVADEMSDTTSGRGIGGNALTAGARIIRRAYMPADFAKLLDQAKHESVSRERHLDFWLGSLQSLECLCITTAGRFCSHTSMEAAMDGGETAQLQDEDEWDFEAAVRLRAPEGRRAVVAVSFTVAEFSAVAEAAEQRGQKLTEFIRDAALGRAHKGGAAGGEA
jgi:hypothetical protein